MRKKRYLSNQETLGNSKNKLFSSKTNFKVKRSVSYYPQPTALGTDVFAIPSNKLNNVFQHSFLLHRII